jgi:hypothetical protein
VAKLRSEEALDVAEQRVHTLAACGVLRDLHDELDALVASAYGWSWPEDPAVVLERLVALHEERVEEERKGVVRWLRPDYQQPRFGAAEERVEGLQLTPGRQLQQLRQRRTAGPGRETPLVKWASPPTTGGRRAALR